MKLATLELADLQDAWAHLCAGAAAGVQLPVNILETADAVIVAAQLPGCKLSDLRVEIDGCKLTLRADPHPPADEPGTWCRQEYGLGAVERVLDLPAPVRASGAVATYADGILRVTFPRAGADEGPMGSTQLTVQVPSQSLDAVVGVQPASGGRPAARPAPEHDREGGLVVERRGTIVDWGIVMEYYTARPDPAHWVAVGRIPAYGQTARAGTFPRLLVGAGDCEGAAIADLGQRLTHYLTASGR